MRHFHILANKFSNMKSAKPNKVNPFTGLKNVFFIKGLNHWNKLAQRTEFVLTEISLTPRGYEMGGYYK